MKRMNIFFLTIFVVLTSCQDFLDLKPKNKVVMNTLEDIKSMASSYLYSQATAYPVSFSDRNMSFPLNRKYTLHFSMCSNDIKMENWLNYLGKYDSQAYFENIEWKGETNAATVWSTLYAHIGYLNEAIVGLENLEEKGGDEWQVVMGEMKGIRAYYIFKLLQHFCVYNNNEYGIPLNLDTQVINAGGRKSQQEIYRIILDELTEVLNYRATKTNWNIFYRKDVLNLMLAEVYWFKAESAAGEAKDWENAERYASAFLKQHADLEKTSEELVDEFTSGSGTPYVLDNPFTMLKFSSELRPSGVSGYMDAPFYPSATAGQQPSDELFQLYDEGDIRLNAFFGYSNVNDKLTPYIYKTRRQGAFTYEVNYIFRVAEAYLIAAEAKYKMNQPEEALNLLKTFKESRKSTFRSDDVLQEIMRERRLEFCYELDFAWLDMKRQNMKVTRKGVDPKSDEVIDYTIEANDYRYALCIPLDNELVYNQDLTNNPGWN